ncbi:hypothetical protein IMZ29_13840 [Achromobacter sp. GG226]|nr:hypothetical protein [Verticiella sp. GG226]
MSPADTVAPPEAVPHADTHPAEPATRPQAPVAAPADLQAVVNAAGMEWVQTDTQRLAAVQADIAGANVAPRLGRERKPAAAVNTEPMVQVETQREG